MSQFVPTPGSYWEDLIGDRSAYPVYQVWLDTDDDGTVDADLTEHLKRFKIEGGGKLEGSNNEAVANTWTVTLWNTTLDYESGDYANAVIVIKAGFHISGSDDVITIFTGYVTDRGISRDRARLNDDAITIKCVDHFARVSRTETKSYFLVGLDICDTTDTDNSILHFLAEKIGFEAADMVVSDIEYTKNFAAIKNDAKPFRELQLLASSYLAMMKVRYDGKFVFESRYQTGYSEPTYEWQIGIGGSPYPSIHKISEKGSSIICNRVKLEFDEYEELPATIGNYRTVYKNTKNYDASLDQIEFEVEAGAYWPGPSQYDVLTCSYRDPDTGEDLVASNVQTPTIGSSHTSDIWCEGGLLTLSSFNGSDSRTRTSKDGSQLILYNGTGSTITVRQLVIRGKGHRLNANVNVECADSTVSNDWEYIDKRISGKYVNSIALGKETCEYWMEYGKTRRREFEVETDWLPQVQEGAIVRVWSETDTYVDCIVESYKHFINGPGMRTATTKLDLRQFASFTYAGGGTSDEIDRRSGPTSNAGQTLEQLLSLTELGGGDITDTDFTDNIGGADFDTGIQAVPILGGMRMSEEALESTGDTYLDSGVTHVQEVQMEDENGRSLTITKTDGIKIVDGTYNQRTIEIGAGKGIKATDADGETIHDIPTNPFSSGNLYLGHLIWLEDNSQYELMDLQGVTNSTWTDLTCIVDNNTNVKGVLLRVTANTYGTASSGASIQVWFRPNGTSWTGGISSNNNCPGLHNQIGTASNEVDGLWTTGMVAVPIGDDNKIQFYCSGTLSSGAQLEVSQVGLFI